MPTGRLRCRFNLTGEDFDAALAAAGAMPLPPYIAARRAPDAQDRDDYQTVLARACRCGRGADGVSLHFDERPAGGACRRRASQFTHVTLHVGAGTFLPVKVDDVTTHKMHAEWGEVTRAGRRRDQRHAAAGGRVIPVGTTALRLIESAADDGQAASVPGGHDRHLHLSRLSAFA